MTTETTAPLGVSRFSAYELIEMSVARNVAVLPSTESRRTLNNGGPVLPDWDKQVELRHARFGVPMESYQPAIPDDLPYLDESFIWGGWVERQFGHLVCEYSTRVLPALARRPQDRLLFALWPGAGADDVPQVFWDLLAWYGVARERVMLVDRPLHVREVWIAPQPEQLHGVGPSAAYLRLLERNASDRRLKPVWNRAVYVARTDLLESHQAAFLGEGYLADRLAEIGVAVITPRDMPLQAQLEHYAGAERLIFAEGSAVHGRQLLGYVDQEIAILARRPGARIALQTLMPRCRTLSYAEATQGLIRTVFHDGSFDFPRAGSVFDTAALLAVFDTLDLPLRDLWNDTAYRAQCHDDVLVWLKHRFNQVRQRSRNYDWDKTIEQVRADLVAQGLGDAATEGAFWLRRKVMAD